MNAHRESLLSPSGETSPYFVVDNVMTHDSKHVIHPRRLEQEAFMARALKESGKRLFTLQDLTIPGLDEAIPSQDYDYLKLALAWVQKFIMRPHPGLNRPGAVCPAVKMAIDEGLLYFTVAHPEKTDEYRSVADELRQYAKIFHTLQPESGELAGLKAFVILMPECEPAHLTDHKATMKLKTELLHQNLMLGQFFPINDPKEALKSKFFPVQPPFPIYSMRTMLESDWVFLQWENEWRQIYETRFGAFPQP